MAFPFAAVVAPALFEAALFEAVLFDAVVFEPAVLAAALSSAVPASSPAVFALDRRDVEPFAGVVPSASAVFDARDAAGRAGTGSTPGSESYASNSSTAAASDLAVDFATPMPMT